MILGIAAAFAAIAAPTAAAAAPKPGPVSTAKVRVAQVERQFCAVKSVTGRGVDRVAVKSPVRGTISVRTEGARGSDWDLAIVDVKRDQVLTGSAQPGASEYASTFVRKGQRLALQTCRRDGSSKLTVRYAFTALPKFKASSYATKLVRVGLTGAASKSRVAGLGLDVTDHPTETHWDVLLHSKADEAKLKDAGLDYTVRIGDVARKDRENRLAEQRAAKTAGTSALVGGRTSYRTLAEIESELRALAEQNPGLVRLVTLPGRSWEGRQILGVEIAENVNGRDDGRPAFVQVGTHHAREWPANEATLEWGLDLVNGYKTGNPRLTAIVKGARNFVVPVLNVDGFDVTIQAEGITPGGNLTDPLDSTGDPGGSGNSGAATGAYKRKNCRPEDGVTPPTAADCLARSYPNAAASADDGIDLNRNYGVEWGGPGTGTLPYPSANFQTQHGPAPFSEPETHAFRDFLRDLQPAVLITNHTFTGLLLRPPGTARFGPVPDEERLRALGDAMANATNYISQFSYQLYDTTGTTDDYLYDGLGSFSFTPEIGKVEFHPAYTEFAAEYEGRPEVDRFGDPTGVQLGGLREAYTLAGEAAIHPSSHSIIQGTAPAGRTLRIRKNIIYRTSEDPDDDGFQYPVQTITEPRNSTTQVKPDGSFVWHVSPSRQPRDFGEQPGFWTLTCEDDAGNVLESRNVYVERAGVVNVELRCGQGTTPVEPGPVGSCPLPDGFESVDVSRRGNGLRISFDRKSSNQATVDVFQTSAGRRVFSEAVRQIRFQGREGTFNWNGRGRGGKRLKDGVYFVRFRILDANERTDSRRVVVQRKNGRFSKRADYYLIDRCG